MSDVPQHPSVSINVIDSLVSISCRIASRGADRADDAISEVFVHS